jgi:spore germination protein PE
MLKRTSKVDLFKVNSVFTDSIVNIGDSKEILPEIKVLAVQRHTATYFGNEGSFQRRDYQTYYEPFPYLLPETSVHSAFFHEKPLIRVRSIKIQAISSASVFQIGSSSLIDAKSRTKHIRHLLSDTSRSST